MTDPASWKSNNHSGFVNLQVTATPRLDFFAATAYNRGDGTIEGLSFDPTTLPGQPAGLDFRMQAQTMPAFSALDVKQISQTVGVNFKASDRVLVHGLFEYDDFNDNTAYLYNATGRHVSFMAGVSWIF